MSTNRREYYRIEYPLDEQPVLGIGRSRYRVRECSEKGFSFVHRDASTFSADTSITGTLEFASGERADIAGRVVRVVDDFVAVELVQSIPFSIILGEQRRLYARRGVVR
jgi:hypothetical protein